MVKPRTHSDDNRVHNCETRIRTTLQKTRRRCLKMRNSAPEMSQPDHSASQSPSSQSSNAQLWDVQEILAERTSISGEREVLVVWKCSWIPKSNLMEDGPVLRRYNESRKWTYVSTAGAVILPVEPGSTLQQDCVIAIATAQARRDAASPSSGTQAQRQIGTPRKSLGGVAKAASTQRQDP